MARSPTSWFLWRFQSCGKFERSHHLIYTYLNYVHYILRRYTNSWKQPLSPEICWDWGREVTKRYLGATRTKNIGEPKLMPCPASRRAFCCKKKSNSKAKSNSRESQEDNLNCKNSGIRWKESGNSHLISLSNPRRRSHRVIKSRGSPLILLVSFIESFQDLHFLLCCLGPTIGPDFLKEKWALVKMGLYNAAQVVRTLVTFYRTAWLTRIIESVYLQILDEPVVHQCFGHCSKK